MPRVGTSGHLGLPASFGLDVLSESDSEELWVFEFYIVIRLRTQVALSNYGGAPWVHTLAYVTGSARIIGRASAAVSTCLATGAAAVKD